MRTFNHYTCAPDPGSKQILNKKAIFVAQFRLNLCDKKTADVLALTAQLVITKNSAGFARQKKKRKKMPSLVTQNMASSSCII
jgi:hypothetical protein